MRRRRLSAIGYRLSAIGYRLSAIGYRLSAIGQRTALITQFKPVTGLLSAAAPPVAC